MVRANRAALHIQVELRQKQTNGQAPHPPPPFTSSAALVDQTGHEI